jgi:hypothetical protein
MGELVMMRAGNILSGRPLERVLMAAAGAVVVFGMAVPVSAAASIPVVQGDEITVGAVIRQPIARPAVRGFNGVNASSSDSGVVRVGGVTLAGGIWGVNLTVTGAGIATVTVQWSNAVTGQIVREYFVVASGVAVDRATAFNTAQGNVVLIPASQPLSADIASPQAVVSPRVRPDGVSLTAENIGTSIVNIRLPRDDLGVQHYQVVIVTVEQTAQPTETSST